MGGGYGFETVPEVQEALVQRVAHGVYGYSVIPDEWADSYVNWWEKRHHFRMDPKKLIFTTGVIPALSSAVRKLTTPAENVLIQTPVYNNFFNSIRNNGRNVVENELLYDGKEYRVDWEKLEQQLADPQTTLMILCNPQNPAGNIWDYETLARIGALCKQYDVIVVSDEIHCDLTKPGTEYIPFASVDDTCRDISVTCIAPTKTFNLAGLQTAAVYAENSILHHRMWRQLNTDEVAEPNAFAIQAAIAAFQYGEEWLDELREYVEKNKQYVTEFLQEKIPLIHPVAGDATYLMWLDCRKITESGRQFVKFIRKTSGLYVSGGNQYGRGGEGFLRVNVATSKLVVEDGMQRLYESVDAWLKEEKISK